VRVAEHAPGVDQLEEAAAVLLRSREESGRRIGVGEEDYSVRTGEGRAAPMTDLAPVSGAVALGSIVWCVPTPAASTAKPALARRGTTSGAEPMS
jgi:hypothetical protein